MINKTIVCLLASVACATSLFAGDAVALNPGYEHGTYSFSGTVETEINSTKLTTSFSGKTTHESFECEWTQDIGPIKSTGKVTVDKSGGVLGINKRPEEKIADPDMAIAGATGISAGSANLMYSLWTGERSAVWPFTDVKVTKRGEGTEIAGALGIGSMHSAVTVKDGMVVSVVRTITEQWIEDAVKATGKPELEPIRKRAHAMIESTTKGPITWTTKVNVVGLGKEKTKLVTAREALVAATQKFPEEEYGSIAKYTVKIMERKEDWVVNFEPNAVPRPLGGEVMVIVQKKDGSTRVLYGE